MELQSIMTLILGYDWSLEGGAGTWLTDLSRAAMLTK